jgi:hypothetical protein
MKWFGGTGDCLGFIPSCETEKWTENQWKEYDEFRKVMELSSRKEMGEALHSLYEGMVKEGYIKNENILP